MEPEFRDDVARVVEAAERAADSWQTSVTDFQPPPVVAFASAAVAQLAGVGCVAWGGYPQASTTNDFDVLWDLDAAVVQRCLLRIQEAGS